jgi:iron complex outermembrane receptor protein
MPSPEETLLPAGTVNPDIRPEQGIQYEAGTRMNLLNEALEAEISVYWIELDNLLLTKRITEDIFTGINAGKTRHQGLELLLRSRIPDSGNFPGKLKTTFSYTFSRNRFIDFTDDGNTYDGNELPGIPEHYAQLQLNWNPAEKLELSTHFLYTGNQHINDANTMAYEGYFLLNLKALAQFNLKKTGKLRVFAGINNLTNTHYASMLLVNAPAFGNSEPRYYYPGLPKHFYAGVEVRF